MDLPSSSYLLEKLRLLFQRKEAFNFAKQFEGNTSLVRQLSQEEQQELAMMAAFVYFELKSYKLAASYCLKVNENLQKGNLVNDAHELFREMSFIGLRSYLARGRVLRGYFFIRKMVKAGLQSDTELYANLNILYSRIAGTITRILDYSLPIAGISAIVFQRLTHKLSRVDYILLLAILFIVSTLYYVFRNQLFQKIQSALSLSRRTIVEKQ